MNGRSIILPLLFAAQPALAANPLSERVAAHLALRAMDERLVSVAERLVTANAPYCRVTIARTGLLLHDLRQYPDQEAAREAFGLADHAVVEVATGAANAAGVLPGDELVSVKVGRATEEALPSDARAARDAIDRAATRALADGQYLYLRASWQGHETYFALTPHLACASLFQVVPGKDGGAGADGAIVSIGPDLIAEADTEDALAAIVAHELAHNLLDHRTRIAAAADKMTETRATEDEADRLSIWLLANAGYDPDVVLAFWEKRAARRIDFPSPTHRPWSQRIAIMRAERAAMAATPLPARPPLLAANE